MTKKDVAAYWADRASEAKAHAESCELCCTDVDLGNPFARCGELTMSAQDGQELRARMLVPADGADHPVVLMFHDANRGIRGWHHMMRFLGFGYAVLALENRPAVRGVLVDEPLVVGDGLGVAMRVGGSEPERIGRVVDELTCDALEATYLDALVLAFAAARLEGIDATRMVTWGEGLGGGIALVVAKLAQTTCAISLNALPCALDDSCARVDVACIASGLSCPTLLGTCMLDLQATPESHDVLVEGLTHVRRLCYPRYSHERVNAFEDELVAFLVASAKGGQDAA